MRCFAQAFIVSLAFGDNHISFLKCLLKLGAGPVQHRTQAAVAIADHSRYLAHTYLQGVFKGHIVNNRRPAHAKIHSQLRKLPAKFL